MKRLKVIDLFAGPGGLSEGFAAYSPESGFRPFRTCLSIEKDPFAHQTLELRNFFHQFPLGKVPAAYYRCLRGELKPGELYALYPKESKRTTAQAWRATLGETDSAEVDRRVGSALGSDTNWILIGGPPCQAYSTANSARAKSSARGKSSDPRHFLYKEYLRIISQFWPSIFVMENVKGILSAKVGGRKMFGRILEDLYDPGISVSAKKGPTSRYRIYSLVKEPKHDMFVGVLGDSPHDFVIECERCSIPQARHRVILLGVRDDIHASPGLLAQFPKQEWISADRVLDDLPRLRSGLSKEKDSRDTWRGVLESIERQNWLRKLSKNDNGDIAARIRSTIAAIRVPRGDRGKEFMSSRKKPRYRAEWFHDPRLGGVCNNSTRQHIRSDLERYMFAACYGEVRGFSPRLKDFPVELRPDHKSTNSALRSGNFNDRFRVQVKGEPSTTVLSHAAKDGHYYIHHDPSQCRSLTVREMARLQTFPDNYYFCGNRTEQYTQVGNAVPPLLAVQIAEIVHELATSN